MKMDDLSLSLFPILYEKRMPLYSLVCLEPLNVLFRRHLVKNILEACHGLISRIANIQLNDEWRFYLVLTPGV
jgi:hypothetical protein